MCELVILHVKLSEIHPNKKIVATLSTNSIQR